MRALGRMPMGAVGQFEPRIVWRCRCNLRSGAYLSAVRQLRLLCSSTRAPARSRAAKLASLIAFSCCACAGGAEVTARFGGDPAHGEQVVKAYGCAACHAIPGIARPRGFVGPPLEAFARRTYIAGELPNTPANLVRWVMEPRAIAPHTAMPALGLSHAQAQDVAAYLFTLD
jgi:cytochrome c2